MIDAGVHQQLGTLIAEVKNLREDFRRSEDRSEAGRVSMSGRMEELVKRVSTLEGSMRLVKDDIAGMNPVIEDVRRWKLMGMGALGVIGIAGAALGVTFADVVKRTLMLLEQDDDHRPFHASTAACSVVVIEGEKAAITTAYQTQRAIRFDDIDLVDPPAKPVVELVRNDAADRCFGQSRARLPAIGDATGNWFKIGGIACGGHLAAAQQHECAQGGKSAFHDSPRHLHDFTDVQSLKIS